MKLRKGSHQGVAADINGVREQVVVPEGTTEADSASELAFFCLKRVRLLGACGSRGKCER